MSDGKVFVPHKMSANEIDNLVDKLTTLIGFIDDKDRSKGLSRLFDDLGQEFIEAPASPKLEWHNCMPGGLAEHSIRVVEFLKEILDVFHPETYDISTIVTVGLLHDLGKVGDIDNPAYVENESDWHKTNQGKYYNYNDKLLPWMLHSHRSLYLLQKYGIVLSAEEFQAILIHDGQYGSSNSAYAQKESPLALCLHQADMQACAFENKRWRELNE